MSGPNPEKGVGVTTLAKLFDLTPMRVQQLASAGVVVKVSHGTYSLAESVRNYIKFLRERADRTGGSRELTEVKRLIAEEELKKRKRENAEAERSVVAAEQIRGMVQLAVAKWGSLLVTKLETEAPARLVGKDPAEMRLEMRDIVEELGEASREIFKGEIAPDILDDEKPVDDSAIASQLDDDAEDSSVNS
jgi:hypothetical protein